MAQILDFQAFKQNKKDGQYEGQWIIHELIYVKCYHRYISVDPDNIWLANIECPKCYTKGTTICTGQSIPKREDLMEAADYVYGEWLKEQEKKHVLLEQ